MYILTDSSKDDLQEAFLMYCSPFPEVAESVQQELDTYRAQEDEVKRLKSIMVNLISFNVAVFLRP